MSDPPSVSHEVPWRNRRSHPGGFRTLAEHWCPHKEPPIGPLCPDFVRSKLLKLKSTRIVGSGALA
jgi:hypothetical protein